MDTREDYKEFFKDVDSVINSELGDTYRNIIPNFKEGIHLWLKVEVKDDKMGRFLLRWLYSQNNEKRNFCLCGCELQSVSWEKPLCHSFLKELKNLIEYYEKGSS